MLERKLLSGALLEITLSRLCLQLIESHGDFSQTVLLGIQPRGRQLTLRLQQMLAQYLGHPVATGWIDGTFFRDDFRRKEAPLRPSETHIPFLLEGKRVILIDDVLFTGRSVRAAMDAMQAYGRPDQVELLVLVARKYSRELPIESSYTGLAVNTLQDEKVEVLWKAQGAEEDLVHIIRPKTASPL